MTEGRLYFRTPCLWTGTEKEAVCRPAQRRSYLAWDDADIDILKSPSLKFRAWLSGLQVSLLLSADTFLPSLGWGYPLAKCRG